MKSTSLALILVAAIATVCCFPSQDNNKIGGSSEEDSLEILGPDFRTCVMNTYIQNADDILDFKEEILNFANNSELVVSKIGQEDFDIEEYRLVCKEGKDKIMKFLNGMKSRFSKCFNAESLHLLEIALGFIEDFTDFQCNLSEEELGYFSEDNMEKMKECVDDSKAKFGECFAGFSADSLESNESVEEQICKYMKSQFQQTQQCSKNAFKQCEADSARGINLMMDYVFDYVVKKFECGP